jgi:heme exporter protein C
MPLLDYANPTRFMNLSGRILPWLIGLTVLTLGFGLYKAFYMAPADYQQGETVRIMFIHVPSAWLAMFAYTIIAASALGTLVWRHPLADVSARAAAPWAQASPLSRSSPARSGASPCGAPGGCGTRA